MSVSRLSYLMFGLSAGFVLSWQAAMHDGSQPLRFTGIGVANAEESDGVGVGGGYAPATTRTVSLKDLLGSSRSEIFDLRDLNAREDWRVVIEGFPSSPQTTYDVLQAFVDDRSATRRLIRGLRGVSDNEKRQAIIAARQVDAGGKKLLLERDVRLTLDQIDRERDRIGDLINVLETPRLKALRETLEEQNTRLRAAERFASFLAAWHANPRWGR